MKKGDQEFSILLVEDEPGDAGLIQRTLSKSSFSTFHTTWVTSLAQARERLKSHPFDLLLLDLSLPDATGLETVRKGREAAGSIPLVVLTGHDDPDFALSTLDAGAQDYLVKGSFHDDVLIRALRYAIARSRTEKELRDSENKHRTLFEAIRDAVLLLDDHHIIDCNGAAVSLFGCAKKEDLLGRSIISLSSPQQLTGKTTALVIEEEIQIAEQEGVHHLEWLHIKENGEEFLAEVIITPILLDGETLIQAVVRDITERKEAERQLIQSEEKFRKIFHEGPLGMALIGLDSQLMEVNDELCEMTEYRREELEGVLFVHMICRDDRDEFLKHFKNAKEYIFSDVPQEYCLRTKEGTQIWVMVKESVISDGEGSPLYVLLMLENITERKELMEQLASYTVELECINMELESAKNQALDASRSKSQFMAVMSHEIRNPMNSIIGMAHLLAETSLTQEQKEYVQIFKGAGETLINLIDDILDLTRIESGHMEMIERSFHLHEVVEKTMVLMNMKAREKGLELKNRIHPNVPLYLRGDPGKLRQVITNLFTNAIKFTSQGEISLTIEVKEENCSCNEVSLLFSVKDSGIGIPEDRLEKIFEDFVQGDDYSTRNYGGSGLGLGICRRLVTHMGGEIWVESRVGQGSTFYFTVDLLISSLEEVNHEKERSQPVKPSPGPRRHLHLLLVEDNADNRLLIEAYLKKTDHTLEMVENGQQALDIVKEKTFDLILMDIQMPVMDGYMATGAIRDWERRESREPVPIVALTAYALGVEVEKALKAGCNEHLTKPIKKSVLLEAIARYG